MSGPTGLSWSLVVRAVMAVWPGSSRGDGASGSVGAVTRADGPGWPLSMNEVTRILSAIEQGDGQAAAQLLPLVYDELRKLAARKLAQEQPGQTLQATALVHEAYLRLVDAEKAQHWNSGGHFFAAAAEAMRRIASAAAAKKWPRLFQRWARSASTSRRYASWTSAVAWSVWPGFSRASRWAASWRSSS